MKDAAEQVQELGNLYSSSGKFKDLYLNSGPENCSPGSLKPICPTRWLTRSPAIEAVLDNYPQVIESLDEASKNFGTTTATKANGLHRFLTTGMYLCCLISNITNEGLQPIFADSSIYPASLRALQKHLMASLNMYIAITN